MNSEIDPPIATGGEVFTHTLYHHIAHWAAYVAMMGILITIGVLLSLTPLGTAPNKMWRSLGVFVATLAAWFCFLFRKRHGHLRCDSQ
jgi:hypothetical protein